MIDHVAAQVSVAPASRRLFAFPGVAHIAGKMPALPASTRESCFNFCDKLNRFLNAAE
jgi:hypothetical protein